MNTTLWVIQGLLAGVFLFSGLLKTTQPLTVLEAKVGDWVHDVPLPIIRTVAILEVLGAAGLVLPGALGIQPWLTWLAAAGLVPFMIGAVVIHGRRGESKEVAINLVLVLLLVIVVWGRLGTYAF